jgi:uncharacterized UPF0146 family protein
VDPISPRIAALCARFEAYDAVVEIGVGRRPAVAASLASRGVDVTATDVRPREVPPDVEFVHNDVFDPDLDVYRDTDAIYALNPPPDLHRPIRAIARAVGVPFLFTTLGTDPPAIPASAETLPGDTLFRASERGRPERGDRSREQGQPADADRPNDHDYDHYGDRSRRPIDGAHTRQPTVGEERR